MQSAERMVVSNKIPALPDGNCFWVTLRQGEWFMGTFLPAVYQVPAAGEIGPICEAVMASSGKALHKIGQDLIVRYGLRELTEDEAGEI